jgi:hypothetical protein
VIESTAISGLDEIALTEVGHASPVEIPTWAKVFDTAAGTGQAWTLSGLHVAARLRLFVQP